MIVLVGRLLFKVYLAPQADVVNDLYSFALGLYLMMCIGYLAHWLYQSYVAYSARGNAQTEQCLAYIKEKGIKVYPEKKKKKRIEYTDTAV